ncbi:MAG: hypothetical protein ABGZ53_00630 [Fuerstiella sp.]
MKAVLQLIPVSFPGYRVGCEGAAFVLLPETGVGESIEIGYQTRQFRPKWPTVD